MHVTVNGEGLDLEKATSLQQLLAHLNIGEGRIAVELNGEIVAKSQISRQALVEGDKIEIVQAIGGG
ncbi:MAG: sulfur carrier protein ThiS [Proteobacteria bacterium]|nr:sulfur carrier protein ThiS [Pseudomonadota bacterium]